MKHLKKSKVALLLICVFLLFFILFIFDMLQSKNLYENAHARIVSDYLKQLESDNNAQITDVYGCQVKLADDGQNELDFICERNKIFNFNNDLEVKVVNNTDKKMTVNYKFDAVQYYSDEQWNLVLEKI